jgi:hypothetical protein
MNGKKVVVEFNGDFLMNALSEAADQNHVGMKLREGIDISFLLEVFKQDITEYLRNNIDTFFEEGISQNVYDDFLESK